MIYSEKRPSSTLWGVLVGAILMSGSVWADSAQRSEGRTAPLASGGRLEVDNTIGSIQIEGTDADDVRIAAEIEVRDARSKEKARRFLDDIEIRVEETPGAVYVRTLVPGDFLDNMDEEYEVHYKIRVPRRVQIDAELDVGNVQVDGVSGRICVETHVGEIEMKVEEGSVEASSNVGRIEVSLGQFDGEGRLRFETNVGDIRLTLPSDLAVRLDASVNIGNVDCDFDVATDRNTFIGERVSGDINGGGPTLKARANIGSVRLRRGR